MYTAHLEGKVTLHDQGVICTAEAHTEHITRREHDTWVPCNAQRLAMHRLNAMGALSDLLIEHCPFVCACTHGTSAAIHK